ncbi:MAG: MBL fold metallo-hydrolase [Hyphomicrobium sp.]|jgi:cyclase
MNAPGPEPRILVHALTDYLLVFYAGRDPSTRASEDWNWFDDTAMKLGIAAYVIHRGDEAVVYDTFASIEQALWMRRYLEAMGIRRFTVVYSHWHLDHIAGDAVFADCDVVATRLTAEAIAARKTEIEAGTLWGPPAIPSIRVPNIVFDDRYEMRVGDIALELRLRNIHSADGCVVLIPRDRILLAGDTLEDPLTYMIEVESLPRHLDDLRSMRTWDIARIYPNHGDPRVIMNGGYDKSFIDATIAYVTAMLLRSHDADYLQGSIDDYIGGLAQKGWVNPFEPYREVHAQNLKLVRDYWHDKPLPALEP